MGLLWRIWLLVRVYLVRFNGALREDTPCRCISLQWCNPEQTSLLQRVLTCVDLELLRLLQGAGHWYVSLIGSVVDNGFRDVTLVTINTLVVLLQRFLRLVVPGGSL